MQIRIQNVPVSYPSSSRRQMFSLDVSNRQVKRVEIWLMGQNGNASMGWVMFSPTILNQIFVKRITKRVEHD